MLPADGWAVAASCSAVLLGHPCTADARCEPSILVPQVAQSVILCGAPTECFSADMPVWNPQSPDEDDLLPIDVLYGSYAPDTRSITVYANRIDQDASLFGADPSELRTIVRLHEYAHAIVHLGISASASTAALADISGNETDWGAFIAKRNTLFAAIPVDVHELLAQGITYAAAGVIDGTARGGRMRTVFESLEERHPVRYKVAPEVKASLDTPPWPVVLDAARGNLDCYRAPGFALRDGLEALIRLSPALGQR